MDAGAFSSSSSSLSRKDALPAGLRVLVVDDDPTWLKILEKMLKKCSYQVTTCNLAREALSLLRERKDGFDIVISDVNMPDMDGFKLLEHVGLEMDLPVIMMSVDGETSRVKKGVQHGACDYLLKPIKMKELRNIWQHVFRKRIHEARDFSGYEVIEGLQMTAGGFDLYDGAFSGGEQMVIPKKRKDTEFKHDDKELSDTSSSMKKARVVWSVDLHQKFVKAVNQIGFEKVGPKRILDLMNVPWLTRENVASHLQKYRLYLTRLQKDNDLKTSFCGIPISDVTAPNPVGGCSNENTFEIHPNEVVSSHVGFSGVDSFFQNTKPVRVESNGIGDAFQPMSKTKRKANADTPDGFDWKNSGGDLDKLFVAVKPEARYATAPDASIPSRFSWREVPEINFQQGKHINHSESKFRPPPLPSLMHSTEHEQPGPAPAKYSPIERTLADPFGNYLLYSKNRTDNHCEESALQEVVGSRPPQFETEFPIQKTLETAPAAMVAAENQGPNLSCVTEVGSSPKNLSSCGDSHRPSPEEVLQMGWPDDDFYSLGPGNQLFQFPEFGELDVVSEVPEHLYDTLRFDYEQVFDASELCPMDAGLFSA
ncbi:hypothetical protein MLD38_002360 [Melastoma candidum]|uniref:Uncharacterized protein n=1 Tax=Melastoma candidum TaxID=119954 RepID=A0ACB9S7M7_9MYRT|nr:hypothetical protein MLD38_002360 [Melastoma candidum]